jgi:alkyldihydroxyacetonephosphate synthase
VKSALEKAWVLRMRGFDAERMVACTLLFEGGADEVAAQERSVYRLAAAHGGMKAGAENGERGYQLTFAIAYIRDFMLEHWILGESFETSVSWSEALALCANVKQRLWQEHAKRGLPGRPFVSARVTQLYDSGVCLYFYFAFHYKGVERPSEVFAELERAARDEILRSGGSLSHHHGVGKLRREFLPRVFAPAALAWRRRLAESIDPERVLGAGNG